MKRWLCLFFFCLFAIDVHSSPLPRALNGVIDLSSWDFKKQGAIDLNGEWEFYWENFVSSKQLRLKSERLDSNRYLHSDYLKVPGSWIQKNKFDIHYPGMGYATYRLRILLPQSALKIPLALSLNRIKLAYDLYVNGNLLHSEGVIGINQKTTQHRYASQVILLPELKENTEIILHIANFQYKKGGPEDPIRLGPYSDLAQDRKTNFAVNAFLSGALAIPAIYHCLLFLFKQRKKIHLVFSAVNALVLIRIWVTGHKFIFTICPDVPVSVSIALQHLSVYLLLPLLNFFVLDIFPKERKQFDKKVFWLNCGISGVLIGSVLLTPMHIYSGLVPVFYFLLALVGTSVLFMTTRACKNKRTGAVSFLLGYSVLIACAINDALFEQETAADTQLLQWGIFAFLLAQATVMAQKEWKRDQELKFLKNSLEEQVKQRTHELAIARNEAVHADKEKRRLIQTIHSVVEDERKEIANELHDHLNGVLIALRLSAQRILSFFERNTKVLYDVKTNRLDSNRLVSESIEREASYIMQQVNNLYDQGRLTIKRLRPEMIDMLGLPAAIEDLVDYHRKALNSSCEFDFTNSGDFSKLNDKQAISIYRIIQEALSNIAKHAHASSVKIVLAIKQDQVFLEIVDNGHGFDLQSVQSGVGLISMRERAHELGGNLVISSSDKGTNLQMQFLLPDGYG